MARQEDNWALGQDNVTAGCLMSNIAPQPEDFIGNNVGLPFATYKVLGWFDKTKKFHARGFIVRQTDRVRDPKSYLRPIREIEEATGLNFFPDLDEDEAQAIETKQYQDILVD